MSQLIDVVDSLENRVSKLLHRHEKLKQDNNKLQAELLTLKSQQNNFEEEVATWREKCTSLQLANSMLGSDQHKRDTKLKINALIREIDLCITQLSE